MSFYSSPTTRYQDLTSRKSLDGLKMSNASYTRPALERIPQSSPGNIYSTVSPRINSSLSPSSLYQNRGGLEFDPKSSQLSTKTDFERVTNINILLNKENESLRDEVYRLKTSTIGTQSRVPELENQIMRLTSRLREYEESLRLKDKQLEEKDRKIFELRRQLDSYDSTDRSNIQLVSSNKNLLSEVDKLYAILRHTTKEFDNIKSDNERLLTLPSLVRELTNHIELLDLEIAEKSKVNQSQRAKIDDLSVRVEELQKENEKIVRTIGMYEKEADLLKARLNVEEKRHDEVVDELRRELAVRQKIAGEEARNEIMQGVVEERDTMEARVVEMSRKVKDYEGKILVLSAEIERLNDSLADKIELLNEKISENEELRRELMNLQREIEELQIAREASNRIEVENARSSLSATHINEKKALEDEIRRLKLELSEIDRMKKAVDAKDKEINDLNKMIQEIDEKNEKRIEELHQHWEVKTKLALEREIRELGTKFVQEKSELEHELKNAKLINQNLEEKLDLQNEEIKRLSGWNESKSQEIINLREENTKKEIAYQKELSELKKGYQEEIRKEFDQAGGRLHQETNKEIERLQKKNDNLESRVLALTDELSKLANTNEDQTAELEQLRLKLRGVEQRHETELKELRANLELESKLKTDRELSEIRASAEKEITALDSKYRAAEQAKRTLEAKYEFLEEDRNKLSEELNSVHKQLFDLRQKQRELENSKSDELDELRKQFESYRQAGAELDQYRGKYEVLFNDMNFYKEKANEIEAVKNAEIQNLKKELIELENRAYKQKRELQDQLEEERRVVLDYKELQIKFGNEKAAYENKIRQLRNVNENGKQEMEKLYDLLNHRKKEHESYVKQNEELRKQVEKLQKQLKSFEGTGDREWQRAEELLEKIEELEKENAFFKEQTDLYAEQLQIKKEELQDRIQEIENLKHVYEISIQKMGAEFS